MTRSCSQLRSVCTLIPRASANCSWVSRTKRRRAATSPSGRGRVVLLHRLLRRLIHRATFENRGARARRGSGVCTDASARRCRDASSRLPTRHVAPMNPVSAHWYSGFQGELSQLSQHDVGACGAWQVHLARAPGPCSASAVCATVAAPNQADTRAGSGRAPLACEPPACRVGRCQCTRDSCSQGEPAVHRTSLLRRLGRFVIDTRHAGRLWR